MNNFDHSSLFKEAELISENFKKVNNQLSETNLAAEFINGLFRDIIYEEFVYPEPEAWQEASVLLCFGAYQSWVMAYINSCAGLVDISNMISRRAIEFVCYLSKVNDDNERAYLWFKRSKSLKNRKKFTNIFSVPRKYFSTRYSHLHSLLVLHEQASEIAAHANFETLVTKLQEDEGHIATLSIQDVNTNEIISIGKVLIVGYKLLESIIQLMKDEFENPDQIQEKFSTLRELIRKARLSLANLDYQGNVPNDVLRDINNETNMELTEQYEKLKNKYTSNK